MKAKDVGKLVELGGGAALAVDPWVWVVGWMWLCSALVLSGCGTSGRERLFHVVETSDLARLEEVLEEGASVSATDGRGLTALHVAAGGRGLGAARRLLDAGAPVDARDGTGSTALHVAVREHDREMVDLLLSRGASINALDFDRATPLFEALRTAAPVALVRRLLDEGSDLATIRHFWETSPTCLEYAVDTVFATRQINPQRYANAEAVLEMAGKLAVFLDNPPLGYDLEIYRAVHEGDAERVRRLLAAGHQPDGRGAGDQTGLHLAASRNDIECMRAFLEAGAERGLPDRFGRLPLQRASQYGALEAMELLLEGFPVEELSADTANALYREAVLANRGPVVELLMRHGVPVKDGVVRLARRRARDTYLDPETFAHLEAYAESGGR